MAEQINDSVINFPRIDFSLSDYLKAGGEAAWDHRGVIGTALLASTALSLGYAPNHASASALSDVLPDRMFDTDATELAVRVIDTIKWPLLVGAGGAFRVRSRRSNELAVFKANINNLQEQLSKTEHVSQGGLFSRQKAVDQKGRLQLESTMQYYQIKVEKYNKENLTSISSREAVREFAEGVALGFAIDAFPQLFGFVSGQIEQGVRLINAGGAAGDALIDGVKTLGSTFALLGFYFGLGRRFWMIQDPGGKTGREEDNRSKKNE